MATLILISEGSDSKSFNIGHKTIVIGREGDVDVLIASDSVSSKHALITFEDGHHFLNDTGSTNGTFVNGERIKRQALKNRDLIRFGQVLAMFELSLKEMLPKDQGKAQSKPLPKASAAVTAGSDTASSSPITPRPRLRRHPAYKTAVVSRSPSSAVPMNQGHPMQPPTGYIQPLPSPSSSAMPPMEHFARSQKNRNLTWVVVLLCLAIPASILITMYVIVSSLPLNAREAMLLSKEFQTLTWKTMLRSSVIEKNELIPNTISLDKNVVSSVSAILARDARMITKLEFRQRYASPITMTVEVVPSKEGASPVLSQKLEIPAGTEYVTLFSIAAVQGTYAISCTYEKGGEELTIPATMYIYIEYD
jgi:pSer/pThr/pTyr-binding forkhead associated (FHA) protein